MNYTKTGCIAFFNCIALFLVHATLASGECVNNICYSFSTYGFESTRSFGKDKMPLQLASAGMRAKNLFITKVDVYAVGIFLSDQKISDLQGGTKKTSFTDVLSENLRKEQTNLAIVLKFVRDVGLGKIVDALVDALSGKGGADPSYDAALQNFQKELRKIIGDNGMKKGEEIQFSFDGSKQEEIVMSAKGANAYITNRTLKVNLVDVYTGLSAVAPDVIKNLNLFLSKE